MSADDAQGTGSELPGREAVARTSAGCRATPRTTETAPQINGETWRLSGRPTVRHDARTGATQSLVPAVGDQVQLCPYIFLPVTGNRTLGERWANRTCESSCEVTRLGSGESHDRMKRSGTKEKWLTVAVTVMGAWFQKKGPIRLSAIFGGF